MSVRVHAVHGHSDWVQSARQGGSGPATPQSFRKWLHFSSSLCSALTERQRAAFQRDRQRNQTIVIRLHSSAVKRKKFGSSSCWVHYVPEATTKRLSEAEFSLSHSLQTPSPPSAETQSLPGRIPAPNWQVATWTCLLRIAGKVPHWTACVTSTSLQKKWSRRRQRNGSERREKRGKSLPEN